MRAAGATLGRIPRVAVALPRAIGFGPHGRRRLIALALVAAVLGAGYMLWLRDSSLVRISRVTVVGLSTADGPRVRAKLEVAARHMTTLHVDAGALRQAVADEPIVQSLQVQADFPHGLKITIVQNRPVALLVGGGREVVVAPDGTLLDLRKSSATLPTVRVGSLPSSGRIAAGPSRDRVAVAAAAPPGLLSRVESISSQHGRGAVAQVRRGPVIIFGRPVDLEAKWAAAVAVLAQRSSQGATYIDVRMPDRPVAGGLALQQDPQPQAQAAGAGVAAGSPGVVPAVPGAPSATTGAAVPATGYPAPATSQQSAVAPAPSGAAVAPAPSAAAPATPAAGSMP